MHFSQVNIVGFILLFANVQFGGGGSNNKIDNATGNNPRSPSKSFFFFDLSYFFVVFAGFG